MSVRSIAVNYTVNVGPLVAGNRAAATSMGQVAAAQSTVAARSAGVQRGFRQMATGAGLLNPALLGPAGAVIALKKMFDESRNFEHQFADVAKTVDGTDGQLAKVASSLRQLSTEMPNTAEELTQIASAAGQVGVGVEHIEEFSRVMAMVGTATNMAADEAAIQFARFANITQTPLDQVEALASTVVALGNNFAAQESEIVNFAMRIAGAGTQVGMANDQIFALSTALPAMGLNAEMGGSAVSRVLVEIATAVDEGGDKLDEFARVSGMTAEQFATAWRDDAAGAFLVFLEGLQAAGAAGESTFQIIDELGLANIRTQDTLLRGASAWEVYGRALGLSAEEIENVTALQDEFDAKSQTTNSQLQILWNNTSEMFRQAGDDINEVANGALPKLNEQLSTMNRSAGMLADADVSRWDLLIGMVFDPQGTVEGAATTLADHLKAAAAEAKELEKRELFRSAYADAVGAGADAAGRLADSTEQAAWAGQLAADSWSGFGREVEGTLEAIQDYNDAILAMEDPLFAVEQATNRLATEQEKLAELQADSDTTAAEYEAQLWRVAAASSGQEQALLELWATMDDGTFTAEQAADRFRALGESAGLSEGDIERLIGMLGGFVDQANDLDPVKVEMDARAAAEFEAKFRSLFDQLDVEVDEERVVKAVADVENGRMTVDAFSRFMDAEMRKARVAELLADASSGIEVVDSFTAAADRAVLKERRAEIQANADDGMRVLDSFTRAAELAARDRTMRISVQAPSIPQLQGSNVRLNHAGGLAGTGPFHDGTLKPGEVPIVAEQGEWIINKQASVRHHDLLAAINGGRFHGGGQVGGGRSSNVISGDLDRLAGALEDLQTTIDSDHASERRASLTGAVGDARSQLRQAETTEERARANERLADALQAVERYDRDATRTAEMRRLEEERATLQTELAIAVNREAYRFDQMSTVQQIADLDRRIAAETAFTDEWMRLVGQRQQLAKQEADTARQAADSALAELNRMLDDRTRIFDRLEANETAHLEATADEHGRYADAVARAQRQASDAVQQAVDARTRVLRDAATPNLSGWDHRAHIITEAVGQETDRLTEWAAALDAQRGRGLSDAAVDLLGLRDATPEALHQLRRLAQASDQELADLNAAVARQMATVNATVRAEQEDANSQLARDIADIHDNLSSELRELQDAHHTALAEMNAAFVADQRTLRDELAQIGANSGRSYIDAIAEGVASGIPGLVAQVRRVQDLMRQAKEAEARSSTPTIAGQVANMRASLGLPADPESDAKWQRWVSEGSRTMAEAQRRLKEKAQTFDVGGILEPGFTLAFNGTGQPEHILTPAQLTSVSGGTPGGMSQVGLQETNALLRRLVHAADAGQILVADSQQLARTVRRTMATS